MPRESKKSAPGGVTRLASWAFFFHYFTSGMPTPGLPGQQLTTVHLTGALMMGFLLKPAWERRWTHLETAVSVLCAVLAIGTGAYLFSAYETYNLRAGMPTVTDVVWGILLILIVLEGARRIVGTGLTLLAVFFLFYMYLGSHFPSGFSHRGFSLFEIAETMYLGTDGIHGLPLQVSAKYVVMFIIFGALLQNSGGGQFILDLATTVFGHVRGGPAKVSVLSSSLFGTISGSAVANVMVDGWLTIPLMRRMGCSPAFAAAVEAVASTGDRSCRPSWGGRFLDGRILRDFLCKSRPRRCHSGSALLSGTLFYPRFRGSPARLDEGGHQGGGPPLPGQSSMDRFAPSFSPSRLDLFMFIQGNTPFISALWSCFAIMVIAQLFRRIAVSARLFTPSARAAKERSRSPSLVVRRHRLRGLDADRDGNPTVRDPHVPQRETSTFC